MDFLKVFSATIQTEVLPSQTAQSYLDKKDFWNSYLLINRISILIISRGVGPDCQKYKKPFGLKSSKARILFGLCFHSTEFARKKIIPVKTRHSRSHYKPFSLINCRATSCWNFSKLSKSSFMWKRMRKGRPSSVSSCTENKWQISFLPFLKGT